MSSKPAQARHDAAALPRIRSLHAARLSLREIAEQLDADGLPSPRRGKQWTATAVKRILDRAEENPPSPTQDTIHVGGAVNMTGPLTIFASGPVSAAGPVNITTHEAAAQADSTAIPTPIIIASSPHPLRPSPPHRPPLAGPAPYPQFDPLGLSPDAALMFSDPFFLRRRV